MENRSINLSWFTSVKSVVLGLVLLISSSFVAINIAQAADLKLIGMRDVPDGYLLRPDWPVPNEPGQLFFLQRSTNPNTVVYAARSEGTGGIGSNAVVAYWKRYNTDGATKELRFFERTQAFGVRIGTRDGTGIRLKIRAIPQFDLQFRQHDDGPILVLQTNGMALSLTSAYLEIDEDTLIPRARALAIVGRSLEDGTNVRLDFVVGNGILE